MHMRSEFIVGGQKSGKSRRAERCAGDWLAADAAHRAVLIATAQAGDAEMQARIARHQADRAARWPGLETLEEPLELAAAIQRQSQPQTLLVVDCLTLWLTNVCMPVQGSSTPPAPLIAALLQALQTAPGPVILVSNEIGLGVIPLGAQVRHFVDTLGQLNQAVAACCPRATLMAAGLPLPLKEPPCAAH